MLKVSSKVELPIKQIQLWMRILHTRNHITPTFAAQENFAKTELRPKQKLQQAGAINKRSET